MILAATLTMAYETCGAPKTGTVIGLTFGQGKYLGYTKFVVDTEKHDVKLLDGKLIPVESDKLSATRKPAILSPTLANNTQSLVSSWRPLMTRRTDVITASPT